MSLWNLKLLTETVQIAAVASRDEHAQPTYGSNASFSARVTLRPDKVFTVDEQEVTSTHMVFIQSTWGGDITDRLTLPDGSTQKILSAKRCYDQRNVVHHWEVKTK